MLQFFYILPDAVGDIIGWKEDELLELERTKYHGKGTSLCNYFVVAFKYDQLF